MTDPDHQAMNDLIKAALVLFVMLELPNLLVVQTHDDNPEIKFDEVIELTITRSKVVPPQHPLPVAESNRVIYPVEVDKELSVVFEVSNLDFKPKEKKELIFTHKAYDFAVPKISGFLIESLFSVDKGVITITNDKNKKATLDKLQVYGRKYYKSAETFAGVVGYAEGVPV